MLIIQCLHHWGSSNGEQTVWGRRRKIAINLSRDYNQTNLRRISKQTGGRFRCILSKLVFYYACCRVLLDKISKNISVSWNDSVGSVSARTVLIKWLILRVQSQAHWGEETIFDWGPGGLESAWSVGSRLIFRYRDMERERRHEDIVI